MLVQFLEAPVIDADAVRAGWERWIDDLGRVEGWEGAVGGLTADGRFVAVSRFTGPTAPSLTENAEAWREAGVRSAELTVDESDDVHEIDGGDHPAAGFVQLMRANVRDRAELEAIEESVAEAWAAHRPDFLGGYRVWLPGGDVLAVDLFTSEAEARAGEADPPPAELQAGFERWQQQLSDTRWYDVTEPWHARS